MSRQTSKGGKVMGQHIIAVDMSTRVARVVVIEASLRSASLLDVQTVELAGDKSLHEKWQAVYDVLPKPIDSLIVNCEAKTASTRLLSFPFADARKVANAIDFELEGQIPYALSDVAATWGIIERRAAATEVLTAIVPKAPLLAHLSALSEVGLEARAVVLAPVALGEFLSAGPGDEPEAILCLGASESHLAVGKKTLAYGRTLRVGGDDVDRAVAKRLQLSLADAKALKELQGKVMVTELQDTGTAAARPEVRLAQAIEEGLMPLLTHLLATFKSLAPGQAPRRLRVTGGLSRLPGLAEYLAARLRIDVTLLDLRHAASFLLGGPSDVDPEHAVALGMATALFRHGRDVPLNFRRGSLAYQGDMQLYRGQFTRIAVGLAAVFSLAIFTSVVRYTMLRADERAIDAGFCNATKHIVGREICNPTAALATLKQAPGAEGTTIPSYSATALFDMLSKAIGSEVDLQLEELDVRVDGGGAPERLTAKGEAASFEATEQVVSLVKRDACVQEAEVSKLRRGQGSNRVEFFLTVKVVCPAGVMPGTRQALASNAPTVGAAPAAPGVVAPNALTTPTP